ncbi:MarR family transcriptional regulator [Ramlibacter sp. G-1-2-2]|uniref:MarR family transcriptional regulator n=1 Tax=Ramlibacter agri TaxID=2728837 RepID=A0A848H0D2_9BURK|nr:MarR family transcriptional regulator [Ramlibacter agri]NML44034.1 MarR family transcriptional regulator [Ramlibacter agri]
MKAASGRKAVQREVGEDLYEQPGHLIRRAHQIAQGMFDEHVGRDVTPIQYAILRMVHEVPGIDQVGLARRIALDTSTTATAAARLESKGLLERTVVATNRRQLQLHLTPAGEKLLDGLVRGVHEMRSQLLDSLDPDERELFIALLRKFVHLNNEQSRAPLQLPEAPAAPAARKTRRA